MLNPLRPAHQETHAMNALYCIPLGTGNCLERLDGHIVITSVKSSLEVKTNGIKIRTEIANHVSSYCTGLVYMRMKTEEAFLQFISDL